MEPHMTAPADPPVIRPDLRTVDDRRRASPAMAAIVVGALLVVAGGDYVVFRDQISAMTGEAPVNAALLTLAMVLGVQLIMHLVALAACRRRAGLSAPGLIAETCGVLAWLALCGAMFGLRASIPVGGATPATGQQVVGAPVEPAGPDITAALQQDRFAWLCLALALISGVAAYLGTVALYRPRAVLLQAADRELTALDREIADAAAEEAESEAVLEALAAAVARQDELRDVRSDELRALAEEAAERARVELIGLLEDPTDTTRITRGAAPRVTPEDPPAAAAA